MQVRGAGRASRPALGPDLAFHHEDVSLTPGCEQLVMSEHRLGEVELLREACSVARDGQKAGPPLFEGVRRHPQAPRGQQRAERVPHRWLPQASFESIPFLIGERKPVEIAGGLQARYELEFPELNRLEAARRCKLSSELEEILWRHRLENRDLVYEDAFDCVHSFEEMASANRVSFEEEPTYRIELEQELLEPQLVHLVNRDEQELVVGGWIG
jgi:hypothetical protein